MHKTFFYFTYHRVSGGNITFPVIPQLCRLWKSRKRRLVTADIGGGVSNLEIAPISINSLPPNGRHAMKSRRRIEFHRLRRFVEMPPGRFSCR